ncbi:AzlD domain-containing protein [Paenibacillus aurantiacus]|uniref:AzlD domain-containing protein n=1 Tax=Paenibacillus aurantiacus TaxID=1936118 RepID=A0ABV5KLI6_9BACL
MTIAVIALMGLITFAIRFAPLLIARRESGEEGDRRPFLAYLPLAVLSALTVPGVFQVDQETPWVGAAAGIAAALLALAKKVPLFGLIAGSVLVAVLVKFLAMP